MSCFTNYIGVKGCPGAESESGLYINSLPGVTLQSIDMIANSEQITFLEVFKEVEARSSLKLTQDITNYLKKRYKLKTITQSINLGKRFNPAVATTPSTTQYRGFSVDLGYVPNGNQLAETQLQQINVQTLSLYADNIPTNPVLVEIINKETGEAMWSKYVTIASTGWQEIQVNQSFRTTALMCYYDANGLDSVSLPIPQAAYGLCQSCSMFIFGPNCRAMLYGIESHSSDPTIYDQGWDTFGLTGVFSIGCSYEGIICDTKSNFADAYLYLLGTELMVETAYSDRLNEFTTVKRADAEELRAIFQVEYEKRLANALDGIEISLRNCCIECNYPYQVRESRM